MSIRVSQIEAKEKTKKGADQPKLLWPGHLDTGKNGKVVEELRKEGIEPNNDNSKRYCKVNCNLISREIFIKF